MNNKSKKRPDISEQEHQQMLCIFDSIDEPIYVADSDTYKILYANRALTTLFGKVIGRKCYRAFQNLKKPCSFCSNKHIFGRNLGKTYIWEFQNRINQHWYHCIDRAIRWPDGRMVRYEMAIDVTERKQSEEKYKTLTENINVGIYRNTVGPKGKFIEANPAIIKMFGYNNRKEFLSISVVDLYRNANDRKKFNEKMLTSGFVKDEELLLRKKDGTQFYGSVSAVAVKNEKGKVLYYDGIIEDITERIKAKQRLEDSYRKLQIILDNTVNALASTTHLRDPYTTGHQQRVTRLACAIAKEMRFDKDRIEGLRVAGIVHDLGKIQVAGEILNKPMKLRDIEMELVKEHSRAGYEILKTIEFPWPVAEIVLQHHERLDGSGYPQGLKSTAILPEARILAVADVIEAMTAHRPYRAALTLADALDDIKKNKGKLFDSVVVDVCIFLFDKGFTFK